jgi:endonuclease YncB( thermonuclease family)
MWRRFSSCESGAAKLRQVHHKIGLLAVAVLWLSVVDLSARDDWTVLENCQLIVNPANDGDSFHVSAGANEYIFRLYLVDAQETDEMIPRRLVEQAKYLGISVSQAIEVGRAAKEFTREKLSEPFAVFTHMSDAMGQSRLERFYAFVQTKDGDLGEQLVRNGLARIYGYKAAPPGLRNSRVEMEKLQQFENQARQEKIGAWGVNIGRLNMRAVNPSSFSFFVPDRKPSPVKSPAASPSFSPTPPRGANSA